MHRTRNTAKTTFEHFLAGAIAIYPQMRALALKGIDAARNHRYEEIEIGKHIRLAVEETQKWQKGGNINLGTVFLLSPLCASAGISIATSGVKAKKLRENMEFVFKNTTPQDAIELYNTITVAKPGGLGHSSKLDVTDPKSKSEILEKQITLLDVFRISAEWDDISREWITNFEITFDLGYPTFSRILKEIGDVNVATVNTYLTILSSLQDTLIKRKAGQRAAESVRKKAEMILKSGGLLSEKGTDLIWRLDEQLSKKNGLLNPGTTADLTAASIMVALLERPRI
ncbi:MAG: triphosphoribosyl-dephospho-CoA synthase [Candidatus Hodarchaeota archaeon]